MGRKRENTANAVMVGAASFDSGEKRKRIRKMKRLRLQKRNTNTDGGGGSSINSKNHAPNSSCSAGHFPLQFRDFPIPMFLRHLETQESESGTGTLILLPYSSSQLHSDRFKNTEPNLYSPPFCTNGRKLREDE